MTLPGFFGLVFLSAAGYLYFQVHLVRQPGVLAVAAVLGLLVLGRAVLAGPLLV